MSANHNGSIKVILFALTANLGIALAKLAGALISGSASLLAESIHSAVDCANQLLLLLGGKLSRQPPSASHPLGYGREAFFWSFMVAIALFALGGIYSVHEGLHKITHLGEEQLNHPALGLGILLFGFVLEAFSFRACLSEIHNQNKHGSLWNWFRRTTASDLLVIFAEDLAALLGLAIAGICLGLAWITGSVAWDALGSILVGCLLLVVAIFLAVEVKSLLIGEVAETDFKPSVEKNLQSEFPGAKVLNLIAVQIGANSVMLSCKFHPGEITEVKKLVEGINSVELLLRKQHHEITWLFFEPDYYK